MKSLFICASCGQYQCEADVLCLEMKISLTRRLSAFTHALIENVLEQGSLGWPLQIAPWESTKYRKVRCFCRARQLNSNFTE